MKWTCLWAAIALALTFSPPPGGAQDDFFRSFSKGEGKPIRITSERLDANKEKEMVVFSGRVVATQDDRVMTSDKLTLYFKKEGPPEPGADRKLAKTGELSRIEAEGNVRITQGQRIVTGGHAVLYNEEQKVVVTGNPVMQDGENVIKGERIIVFLDEKRGVVESSEEKRVSATIYPEDKKEKKK